MHSYYSSVNSSERPHKSVLQLLNINYLYVGYYYCIEEERESLAIDEMDYVFYSDSYLKHYLKSLIAENKASRTYLFVQGKLGR